MDIIPPSGFTSVVKDFGLFVTLIGALVWLGREAIKWFATHIGVPIVTKHLKFVDDLSASLASFDKTMTKVVEIQARLAESQEVILHRLEDMEVRPSRVRSTVDAPTVNS